MTWDEHRGAFPSHRDGLKLLLLDFHQEIHLVLA